MSMRPEHLIDGENPEYDVPNTQIGSSKPLTDQVDVGLENDMDLDMDRVEGNDVGEGSNEDSEFEDSEFDCSEGEKNEDETGTRDRERAETGHVDTSSESDVDVQAEMPNEVQTKQALNEVHPKVQASKLTAAMTPFPNPTMSTVTPSPLPHVNVMPPPSQFPRVNIRAPPPFAPNHPMLSQFSSCVSTQASGSNLPLLVKDGKKFVTLNNLNTVMKTVQAKKKSKTTASKE
ncbi:hypothetical protein Salat_1912200 [Sesamum alatum]|uniref:Uncharacterized protein n=1 Tax=Sesamum alatum TaxID=300844 RepID=A0AAE1Y3X7_9LAMI|nr:hypothetical protein Salat_1912200 [Sesamum alatum]